MSHDRKNLENFYYPLIAAVATVMGRMFEAVARAAPDVEIRKKLAQDHVKFAGALMQIEEYIRSLEAEVAELKAARSIN